MNSRHPFREATQGPSAEVVPLRPSGWMNHSVDLRAIQQSLPPAGGSNDSTILSVTKLERIREAHAPDASIALQKDAPTHIALGGGLNGHDIDNEANGNRDLTAAQEREPKRLNRGGVLLCVTAFSLCIWVLVIVGAINLWTLLIK